MSQSTKRKFVDTEGNSISSNKRALNINFDEENKEYSIAYAIHLSMNVCAFAKLDHALLANPLIGTEIFGAAFTIHQYMRSKHNVSIRSSRLERMETSRTFYCDGVAYSIPYAQFESIWKKSVLLTEDLFDTSEPMEADDTEKNAAATSTVPKKTEIPISEIVKKVIPKTNVTMCLIFLFKIRMRELQVGPDSWIFRKIGDVVEIRSLKTYGIPPEYRHFCSGLSWDPVVRNTLGYMTSGLCQAAILSTQKEELYKKKPKMAVERAFKYFPDVLRRNVTNALSDNNVDMGSKASLLRLLGDMTALFGDSAKSKCSLPISAIYSIVVKEGKVDIEAAKIIGFSSKKAALSYALVGKIPVPKDVDTSKFVQIYFHSIFGTQGEAFGILSQITNHKNWFKRQDFEDIFKKIKQNRKILYEPKDTVKQLMYSKNKNASQVNVGGSSSGTIGVYSMDSGFRKKNISDEILEYVRNINMVNSSAITKNVFETISALNEFKSNAISHIKKKKEEGGFVTGTVAWRKVYNEETNEIYIGVEKGADGPIIEKHGLSGMLIEGNTDCFWSS